MKVVSFPPTQVADVESADWILDASTRPAVETGSWRSRDIPLDRFSVPGDFDGSRVGQLAFSSSDARLVLVDNVYWHK